MRTEPWPPGTELVIVRGPYVGETVIAGPGYNGGLIIGRDGELCPVREPIQIVYPQTFACEPDEKDVAFEVNAMRPPIKDGDATDDELREIEREGTA